MSVTYTCNDDKVCATFKEGTIDVYKGWDSTKPTRYFKYPITTIILPSTLQCIKREAFSGFKTIVEVIVRNTSALGVVEAFAFEGCINLRKFPFEMVHTIGKGAFQQCQSLQINSILRNVHTLDGRSFQGCSAITSINLPRIIKLPKKVFSNCENLVSVTAPNLTDICRHAFENCLALTSINHHGHVVLTNICTIEDSAFLNCKSITTVVLSTCRKFRVLETNAFCYCIRLQSFVWTTDHASSILIGPCVFYYCKTLTKLSLPKTVTAIGANTFYNCSLLKVLVLPPALKSISRKLCYNCHNLKTVTIGDDVKQVGVSAFERCTELMTINLPSSIIAIESNAFYGCSSLQHIVLPPNLLILESKLFCRCSQLTSISLGNYITDIKSLAFGYCTSLRTLKYPLSVTDVEDDALFDTKLRLLATPIKPPEEVEIATVVLMEPMAMAPTIYYTSMHCMAEIYMEKSQYKVAISMTDIQCKMGLIIHHVKNLYTMVSHFTKATTLSHEIIREMMYDYCANPKNNVW